MIEFKEVTKKFGKNTILDSINLTIPEGKITGIIGASGEGKSTLLKMMASFYKPTKGKVYYEGKDVSKSHKIVSRLFGLAIEDGSFYEKLSVRENLFHFGVLHGVKKDILKKRVEESISLVGLTNATETLAENLSIGMKKRLDIACSLIHNPAVLILDEPTADLDPLLRKHMLNLIKEINSHETTIVLTTQLLEEAEEICEKVAILFNEKIVEEGKPSEIMEKYDCESLDEVFQEIFSDEKRKTYQESSTKKTKLKLPKKMKKVKESLILDKKELDKLIEEETSDEDSDILLKEIKGEKNGN